MVKTGTGVAAMRLAVLAICTFVSSVYAQSTLPLPELDAAEESPPQPSLSTEDIPLGFATVWPMGFDPSADAVYYCRGIRSGEILVSETFAPLDEDGALVEEAECGTVSLTTGYRTVTVEVSATPDFATVTSIDLRIRVIPGGITLLPPIIVVILAIATKNVLIALYTGIYVAAFLIHWYDPFRAFLRSIDTYILQSFADEGHIFIILFSWFLSGTVGLMQRAGGAAGIAEAVIGFAKTRRSTMVICYCVGLLIFFDDYSNTLIVGSTFREMFDDMLISREKLAFVVDSTSAPIASISPISAWVGFELSLIDESYAAIEATGYDMAANGYETSSFLVFLKTIPGRYYPLSILCVQIWLILWQRDYGPMLRAERRALKEGKVYDDDADEGITASNEALEPKEGVPKRWYNAVIPIVVIIILVIIGLYFTGEDVVQADPDIENNVENIFGNSDSYSALLWATFFTSIMTIIMYRFQYYVPGARRMQWLFRRDKDAVLLMNIDEGLNVWIEGIKQLVSTTMVLILAWGIGSSMEQLGTNRYIASAVSDSVDARAIPCLVFVISAAISVATGTSWGTMAIMFPIATQAIFAAAPGDEDAMLNTIASILSGAVFGDHVTPISDTTILSSLACRCDVMHHVKTQAPYALTVAAITTIFGDLLVGYLYPTWVGLVVSVLLSLAVTWLLGAQVAGNKPDVFGRIGKLVRGKSSTDDDRSVMSYGHKDGGSDESPPEDDIGNTDYVDKTEPAPTV